MKKNLTIPKTKDLVKKPVEQYKQIYKNMSMDNSTMKNELKEYIKSRDIKKDSNKNIGSANINNSSFSYYNNNNVSDDDDVDIDADIIQSDWMNVQLH